MLLKISSYCVFLILIGFIYENESAKILAVFQHPSKSHMVLGSVLFKALAKRGHEVTVVSAFPLEKPVKNYRDIFVKDILKLRENSKIYISTTSSVSDIIENAINTTISSQEMVLSSPEVQQLMKNESFDLVIHNMRHGDVLFGLSHHFKAPSIGYFTSGSTSAINEYTGNTSPISYMPSTWLPYSAEMTFFQRMHNVFVELFSMKMYNRLIDNRIQPLYEKYFPNGPDLDELRKNVSLVLINTHVSLESPRPYLPNMIQIGGSHIEEPKALPKDLQDYLDGAKNGAIYFSLGSNIDLSNLEQDKLNAIFNVLGNSKLRVLMKLDQHFESVPPNIKFGKWLPQNDILAHPNIKLFISHGGLLSITETVYHGVPFLGIPFFGDQKSNVNMAKNLGIAVLLQITDLNEETFSKSINEILTNTKYTENVKIRSDLLKEQPIKPLDIAIYWVEHVIKHRGALHLRNPGMKLNWYQYYLLDVFAFAVFILILVIYLCYLLVKIIVRLIKKILCAPSKQKIN